MYYSSESGDSDQWQVPEEGPRSAKGSWIRRLDRQTLVGLAVVLVLVAFFGGAQVWDAVAADDPTTGDCAIGLDLTSLVDDDDTPVDETEFYRALYLGWTEQILGHCIDDGALHLTVFAIAGDTGGQDRHRVTTTFEPFDKSADRSTQEDERREWIDEVARPEIEALLDGGLGGVEGTDIISAVTVAEEGLREDVDFRSMWLLTDGVHNGGSYGINVYGLAGRDGAQDAVDSLIGGEHLVPGMLSGIDVHMCGIGGGGPSANISPAQTTVMGIFWNEYFEVADAELDYTREGPDL